MSDHPVTSPRPAGQSQRPQLKSRRATKPTRADGWQLLRVQENERRRIARELHDELGQLLSGLSMELGLLSAAVRQDEGLQQRLFRINGLAEQMGRQMRQLAFELRPALLDDLGLLPALTHYLEVWSQRTGVATHLKTSGFRRRLPVDAETALYRIVQEALTNVARHSHACSVDIQLQRQRQRVALVIRDDGVGFDFNGLSHSPGSRICLGLKGMRERLALLNGTLEVESQPGQGTRLVAAINNITAAAAAPSADVVDCSVPTLEMNDLRAWSELQRSQLHTSIEVLQANCRAWQELQSVWENRRKPRLVKKPRVPDPPA